MNLMQLNSVSLPASADPAQFGLVPGASSALGSSAQTAGQIRQGEPSIFEAMVSIYSREEKSDVPSTPPDLLQSERQIPQDSLDQLSAHAKAAIEALMKDPVFSSSVDSSLVDSSSVDSPSANASSTAAPSPDVPSTPVPCSRITWNGGTLTNAELQIVAVLNRHKDQCPLSWDSLAAKASDPSTPPDLKEAIDGLRRDPELFYAIGSQGDGRCGGKIKAKDLSEFSASHSQVATFQEQQAHSYEQNYIPSDGTSNGQASVMTLNDALRELYKYSDYLPKNLSLDDFKRIVDGKADVGKCPPQLIAAAQHFLEHPDAWKQLCGGATDKIHKEDFLQVASSSMNSTQSELNTLDTINKNQNAFFGDGDLTRHKLASMVEDKTLDPKIREAASQLLSDPLLFRLLNNSITGYKTHQEFFDLGGGHTVDSGNISNNDFTHFYSNMSPANHTVQQIKTHVPKTAAEQNAVTDMMMGVSDQPDVASPKKNGGVLMHAVDDVAKVGSKVLDWEATAVGLLGVIPGLGELADGISMVLEFESQAANLLHTAISGGNMKQALEEVGLNLAAQAISFVAGPEVKFALREGLAKEMLEQTAQFGLDTAISKVQSYAEDHLDDLKARLTEPVQAAGVPSQVATPPSSQKVA